MPDAGALSITSLVVFTVLQVLKDIVRVDPKYYRYGFALVGAAATAGWEATGGDTALGTVLANAGLGAVAVTGTHTLLKGTPVAEALKDIGGLLVKVATGLVKRAEK